MSVARFRKCLAASAAILSMTAPLLVPAPAQAQFGGIVYDPSNYAQNVLTAARTLEQINNQIRAIIRRQQSNIITNNFFELGSSEISNFQATGANIA